MALPPLADDELAARDHLYHTTRDVRLRTRTHIVLLAAEQRLVVPQIAVIVRTAEATVRRWLTRYQADGRAGRADAPRPGAAANVTPAYQERLLHLVCQRPRSLNLAFSFWTNQRLADVLAEETGSGVSDETVRRALAQADSVLSRPQHTITSPDPDDLVTHRRLTRPVTP
jgi:transposase